MPRIYAPGVRAECDDTTIERICDGQYGKVQQNFHQQFDLIVFTHRAELEEC